MSQDPKEPSRLPLWRECAKEMLAQGVAYGRVYTASYFEDRLQCLSGTMEYSLSVSEIRRELERHGFYLSGRGQKGEQFVIVDANANSDVMLGYSRKATDSLKRAVILGATTQRDKLDPEALRRHETILAKMAGKLTVISRTALNRVAPHLRKAEPKDADS